MDDAKEGDDILAVVDSIGCFKFIPEVWSILVIHNYVGLGHILFVLIQVVQCLGKFAIPLEMLILMGRIITVGSLGSGLGVGTAGMVIVVLVILCTASEMLLPSSSCR